LFCHAQRYTGQGYWEKERELFSEDYFENKDWEITKLENWEVWKIGGLEVRAYLVRGYPASPEAGF
jgi:hypothetical protein